MAYAISVPVENQTPGGSISKLVNDFPGLLTIEVDGTDLITSYRAMRTAAAYCREGHGPALVHAHCIRPYSHSLSDDERLTRRLPREPMKPRAIRLISFSRFLVEEGVVGSA